MNEVKQPQIAPPTVLDRIGGFFDRLVYTVAPERGIRRMAFRKAAEKARVRASMTEAGERDKTRSASWLSSRLSPDSALEQELTDARSKSRELYLTDSIGGAVDSRMNLVVSYGFTPQAKIKEKPGLVTADEAKVFNDELEEIYRRIYHRIGKDGKTSVWQALRLIERHHGFDGESITILSDRGDADKPIPLCVDVVDPERMETPPEKIGDPLVRLGIEHDKTGKIIAYWIRNSHSGDTVDVDHTYTRYPAERVLHVFEQWFAGQSRAFPWLIRAINRCKDAKDLDEATILQAQISACYAAFEIAPSGMAGSESAAAAASGTNGSYREQDIRPGTIRHIDGLGQGGDVKFGTPPQFNGYTGFQEHNDRRIAAGLNFPYEMVSKNWSGTSFAGGRLALTDAKLFVKAQQKLIREAWLFYIWNRIVDEAVIVGACSIRPAVYSRAPWWFQRHEWSDPAWPYSLTPVEEVEADILAINNNLTTKAAVCGSRGNNLEDVYEEREKECADERTKKIEPAAAETPSSKLTPQKMEQLAAA